MPVFETILGSSAPQQGVGIETGLAALFNILRIPLNNGLQQG
jgi:hypothetical protein